MPFQPSNNTMESDNQPKERLIHGYDSVDLDILWEILTTDLPQLIPDLKTILGDRFRLDLLPRGNYPTPRPNTTWI